MFVHIRLHGAELRPKNYCLEMLFFLIAGLWLLALVMFALEIGFLVNSCIHRQLEMIRIPVCGEKQDNIDFVDISFLQFGL